MVQATNTKSFASSVARPNWRSFPNEKSVPSSNELFYESSSTSLHNIGIHTFGKGVLRMKPNGIPSRLDTNHHPYDLYDRAPATESDVDRHELVPSAGRKLPTVCLPQAGGSFWKIRSDSGDDSSPSDELARPITSWTSAPIRFGDHSLCCCCRC
ncbi:putative lipoprotein [Anopheles sinensis]|uniref:Putative lipoprotein n=1 Tax=Anopheles sinensis TaxID=74873 RepID=A0A084VIM8_ANOSI|nr:putative lipoprotein [Anopheles sinensis]